MTKLKDYNEKLKNLILYPRYYNESDDNLYVDTYLKSNYKDKPSELENIKNLIQQIILNRDKAKKYGWSILT